MKRAIREYTLTIALLIGSLAVTFYPAIFQDRTMLPSDLIDTMTLPFSQYYGPERAYNSLIIDGSLQLYPLKYFTKQAYERGNFAFWNPYILNGYPQYLDILGLWTYNFVLFLPIAIGFLLILLLPLLVAGVGMYALLREYDVRPGIARIFATAYMLNALFMTHLLTLFVPASFSFAPFVILFLHKYGKSPRSKYLALSAISLALGYLAGNLQTIGFLTIFVVSYWIIVWTIQPQRSFSTLVNPLAIVLGFAIGLSMIILLPTLELFRETLSGGAFFSTSLLRSYNVLQRVESIGLTLTFFIPQLAGSIRGVTLDQIVGVYTQDFEGAIGFIPLLIAVWASISLWKRRPEIRPFVLLMITGLAIPIATPLFKFVYHRFLIIFVFGACGAGALGMEAMLTKRNFDESLDRWISNFAYSLIIITAVLTIFSILIAVDFSAIEKFATMHLLPRLQSIVFSEGNPEWVRARFAEALDYWRLTRPEIAIGLASSFFGLGVLLWRNKFSPNVFIVNIWTITFIQLAYFAHCWFPANDLSKYPLYPETPETKILREQTRDSRVFVYRKLDPKKQFVFMDNENVIYDIPQATGYESVIPRSLYMYSAVIHRSREGNLDANFLGKFNVGVLVAQHPLSDDSLTALGAPGPLWIYKNNRATPRAFLASTSRFLGSDTAICDELLRDDARWPTAMFTPDQHALALHKIHVQSDTVSHIEDNGNDISMQAHSNDTSYLVLTDTYYPGWTATVDNNEVSILRCNYAMRAILVPPGDHKVRFEFRPASFRIGSLVSIATITIMILSLLVMRRKENE